MEGEETMEAGEGERAEGKARGEMQVREGRGGQSERWAEWGGGWDGSVGDQGRQ